MTFQEHILQGIPAQLPPPSLRGSGNNPAPKRKDFLTLKEKELALRNALRYFPKAWHAELAVEFAQELKSYGRIYMFRFKPSYAFFARPLEEYPSKTVEAAAIMMMIHNNLDPEVAQHPEELITYGGNGAVFQNWAQYLLTMQYLSQMSSAQTLHLYSGHPMGLFPSSADAPRVVITNGMMIPNYSQPNDWERFNALGVTQYGQMTAGSFMYIGPQGIVHGTTITLMNAFRNTLQKGVSPKGKVFLTSGLGGMSGAQPKAGNIVGCITVVAEVNPQAAKKRLQQGWVDVVIEDLDHLVNEVKKAQQNQTTIALAYLGNIVAVWEGFLKHNITISIGSDQTSLHNPWSGGYYPIGWSYEDANALLRDNPERFKTEVQATLRRHAKAIEAHVAKGTYFFDYGNAFLLEASRAGGAVMNKEGDGFCYPSYVQDILGPLCFDYGFGPFRWVCASGKAADLAKTDQIAEQVLLDIQLSAAKEIQGQLKDNIQWIRDAQKNKLVVGSQARILYADAEGRIKIATAFNKAIAAGEIGPIVLGRDHHDVSGTDSPYRETSNIYDGSRFTADMAIHNVIGDSFRGATWVSIHNGGGVGWGEVINGGFGLLLDGTEASQQRLQNMLFFDVNNGIARRSWARNQPAIFALKKEMARSPNLDVLLPNSVDDHHLKNLF
ncbi:MAG: urocanate hydratase [Flavobacteriaceae bacterium]